MITARTWFIGEGSGRVALHLSFGVDAAPPTVVALPGQAIRATLAFSPLWRRRCGPRSDRWSHPTARRRAFPAVPRSRRCSSRCRTPRSQPLRRHVAGRARRRRPGRAGRRHARARGVGRSVAGRAALGGAAPARRVRRPSGHDRRGVGWCRAPTAVRGGRGQGRGRRDERRRRAAGRGGGPGWSGEGGAWPLLVSAALLGTSGAGTCRCRRTPWGGSRRGASGSDPERRVLATAALVAVRRRAGRMADHDALALPEPARPDPREAVSGRAGASCPSCCMTTPRFSGSIST